MAIAALLAFVLTSGCTPQMVESMRNSGQERRTDRPEQEEERPEERERRSYREDRPVYNPIVDFAVLLFSAALSAQPEKRDAPAATSPPPPAKASHRDRKEKAAFKPSDVDTRLPRSNASKPNAIAVVIGERDYRHPDIPAVDFAINDARSIKNYLIKVLGYKESNIIYEENPTKASFDAIFGTSSNHRGRLYNWTKQGRSDVFIYYSGHGAPDTDTGQVYFLPSDTDPQAIGLTGYPLSLLFENVQKTASEKDVPNVFVIIDACFSGQSENGPVIKNASPMNVVVKNPLLAMPNAVVMTSSRGSEISSWYPEKGHGMFTYFFLKALKEKVRRGRGQVTVGDVHDFITDDSDGLPYYARRLHGRVQTPQTIGDRGKAIVRQR